MLMRIRSPFNFSAVIFLAAEIQRTLYTDRVVILFRNEASENGKN